MERLKYSHNELFNLIVGTKSLLNEVWQEYCYSSGNKYTVQLLHFEIKYPEVVKAVLEQTNFFYVSCGIRNDLPKITTAVQFIDYALEGHNGLARKYTSNGHMINYVFPRISTVGRKIDRTFTIEPVNELWIVYFSGLLPRHTFENRMAMSLDKQSARSLYRWLNKHAIYIINLEIYNAKTHDSLSGNCKVW